MQKIMLILMVAILGMSFESKAQENALLPAVGLAAAGNALLAPMTTTVAAETATLVPAITGLASAGELGVVAAGSINAAGASGIVVASTSAILPIIGVAALGIWLLSAIFSSDSEEKRATN